MKEKSSYEIQAEKFLEDTQTTMVCDYLGHFKHFEDDKIKRAVFDVTFTRNEKKEIIRFGNSVADSYSLGILQTAWDKMRFKVHPEEYSKRQVAPSAYTVLACLTKYEVGTFQNFCDDYGYSNDSIKAMSIYQAVCKEYEKVKNLWRDVIDKLQEIR
jgi:hypothetical protein